MKQVRPAAPKDMLHRDEFIALNMCFWRIIVGVNLRLFSGETNSMLDPLQHMPTLENG